MPDPLPSFVGDGARRAAALLDLVRETLAEVHGPSRSVVHVTLDSSLERDLGLDSLARVEVLLRVERAFGLTLPENTLQVAQTPRDLLAALDAARIPARPAPTAVPRLTVMRSEAGEDAPTAATTLLEMLDWHVNAHADRTHIVLVSDAGEEEVSYAKLKAGAVRVAPAIPKGWY